MTLILKTYFLKILNIKVKKNVIDQKMKVLNQNNSLQDILIQTDEVILTDIIINEKNEYFLKAGIISDKLYHFF